MSKVALLSGLLYHPNEPEVKTRNLSLRVICVDRGSSSECRPRRFTVMSPCHVSSFSFLLF